MSAEATGWVWKYSPFVGRQLLVHLAIADVVNDVNHNEFWMSGDRLARKAKVSRNTVTTTLAEMQELGLLDLLESGAARRVPSRFRFLFPTSAVTALVSPATGATTAHDMRDHRASTSAVTGIEHARSPRANPRRATQEPKAAKSPPPWRALGVTPQQWAARPADESEGATP